MKLLILVISIAFDLLIMNIYQITTINLNYFYPMFTITSVVYISNFYSHANRKNYYMLVLIIAIIYDTLTTNNLLITILLFQIIAFVNIKLKNNFSNNLFNNILRVIFSILIFDLSFHLILVLVNYQEFSLYMLIYKFRHSIIINVIYIITMFLVLKNKKT